MTDPVTDSPNEKLASPVSTLSDSPLKELLATFEGDVGSGFHACPSCTHPSCERYRWSLATSRSRIEQFCASLEAERDGIRQVSEARNEARMKLSDLLREANERIDSLAAELASLRGLIPTPEEARAVLEVYPPQLDPEVCSLRAKLRRLSEEKP